MSLESATSTLRQYISRSPGLRAWRSVAPIWSGVLPSLVTTPRIQLRDIKLDGVASLNLARRAGWICFLLEGVELARVAIDAAGRMSAVMELPSGRLELGPLKLMVSLRVAPEDDRRFERALEVATTWVTLFAAADKGRPQYSGLRTSGVCHDVPLAPTALTPAQGGLSSRAGRLGLRYKYLSEGQHPLAHHELISGSFGAAGCGTSGYGAAAVGSGMSVQEEAGDDGMGGGSGFERQVILHDGPGCVAMLLAAGTSADSRDLVNATALHKASAQGSLGSVALLLRGSADIEAANVFGDRPLHRAAENGCTAAGRLLIKHGCQIDAPNLRGDRALHVACTYGHATFASLLLNAGAGIGFTNERGWAPLHISTDAGHIPVLALLLSHCKARKLPCVTLTTTSNDSALHVAVRSLRVKTMRWMLNHSFGPALLIANDHGITAMEMLNLLLPMLEKLSKGKGGKGGKSEGGGKKAKNAKKPKVDYLQGITPELLAQRMGADGLAGMKDVSSIMQKEYNVAAAAARAAEQKRAGK